MPDLIRVELRRPDGFAARPSPWRYEARGGPSLRVAVCDVVLVGAEKKMIRPNAPGVVAVVADAQVTRNCAKMQLVREPVSANHSTSDLEFPVALARVGGPIP